MWKKIFKQQNGPKTGIMGTLKKTFQTVKLLKRVQLLRKVRLSSSKFDKSYQTITFKNGHQAKLLKVSPNADPKSAVLKKFSLGSAESLIMVSGDTQNLDEPVQQRLTQLLSRGLVKTAINLNAVLIDNGKTSGLVTLTGQSVADRGHKSPLIGVAAATQVSYPGQTETAGPTVEDPTPLDPNHTHFVLVDTENSHQAMDFRYRLGTAIVSHNPAVMILVNGKEELLAEVLQAVRLCWPIITLTGTGQLADQITDLYQNPPDFIPDPELAEIIADGQIIPFPVEGDIEDLDRLIHRVLRGDNTLKLAWQQFALYDKNATRQQKWFYRLQLATVSFAVLGTLLALLQASLDLQLQQAKPSVLAHTILETACLDPKLQDELKLLKMQEKKMRKLCEETKIKVCLEACNKKCQEKTDNSASELSCEQAKCPKGLFQSIFHLEDDCCDDYCQQQYETGKLTTEKLYNWKPTDELKAHKIPLEHLKHAWKIYYEAHLIARFLARHNQKYKLVKLTEYLVAFLQWVIVAIPIIVTILFGLSNRFSHGQKWIWLRSSAETLKSEIFRYRTKSGIYCVDKDRETKLADKVQCLNNHLMQTEVNLSALKPYKGPLPPQYSTANNDDGFTMLSPERYLNMRLEDQLNYYQKKNTQLERQWSYLQWGIYGLGGLGTLLAARGFELWIALTTGLVAALTSYLGYQQVEERLQKYNKASVNLTNILNWWSALPTSEQAKQENIDQLVSDTETALGSEFREWVQQMQETMMALKEKDKISEKSQMVEPKEISPP